LRFMRCRRGLVRWFREEPAFFARIPCRCPVPSGGWFGPESLPRPTWRFRDRFDALPFRSSGPLRRSSAFLLSFPTAVKATVLTALPLAASAVRQIQTEVILRRVFQHCCGHRCQTEPYVSPSVSAVSRFIFKFGVTVSMT
jgi:hypothetical protein